MTQPIRKRILTGIRPTGPLHLGHYVGALENWVRLQSQYECYFLIADYQALGDHLDDIERIRESVLEVTLDWLAVGLDPQFSVFEVQSYVPEHAELHMLLSMVTPLSWLQRNPTLKAEMDKLESENQTLSLGFFNYPASQVADILLPKAHLVPVGDDQLPHIEMTREVVRRFHHLFGVEVFPEPDGLVGRVARLVGTDGQAKMSKSLNNCIYLGDDEATVTAKVRRMYHRPHAPAGHRPRPRGGQPGVHVPRRLQHRHRRGGRSEGALPRRNRGRRRGKAEAGRRAQRVPRSRSGAPGAVRSPHGRRAGTS